MLWRESGYSESGNLEFYTQENPTEEINVSKQALYKNILSSAEEKLGKPGRILDIGCGTGAFLVVARDRGWDVMGVEPVDSLADEAEKHGINVFHGYLSDLDKEAGKYDLITYWDVLMMVIDPLVEVRLAAEFLSEKGYIYCRVRQHKIVRAVETIWKVFSGFLETRNPTVFHPFNFEPRTVKVLFRRTVLKANIYNGRLTSGDAYGVGGDKKSLITRTKIMVDNLIQLVSKLSGGYFIISPTMDIWAKRIR
ncbi:MAG: class I SAM-dependent methyltransferase [Candidatus Electryonea clarkiae]|nr:class I SAM-dependent methyltransferase [Candidatus Electryonea clarkiae]MDP8288963.1 class I SAM-dependent methyltransferase [Candidatus Electryonea clarkiae]